MLIFNKVGCKIKIKIGFDFVFQLFKEQMLAYFIVEIPSSVIIRVLVLENESNCLHERPGIIGGMPSVGIFLRDPSMYEDALCGIFLKDPSLYRNATQKILKKGKLCVN